MYEFPLPYLFPALLATLVGGIFLGVYLRRYLAEVRIRKTEERERHDPWVKGVAHGALRAVSG